MRQSSFMLVFALGFGIVPGPVLAASDPPSAPAAGVELAFTLDEMNCFSSDVRLRDTGATTTSEAPSGGLLAGESGGGTNGIPCNARDPKAPPARKRARS